MDYDASEIRALALVVLSSASSWYCCKAILDPTFLLKLLPERRRLLYKEFVHVAPGPSVSKDQRCRHEL